MMKYREYDYDVIIVGAGPSGSSVAELTALHGWRTCLIERDRFAGETNVCGGGIEGDDADRIGIPPELIHKRIVKREHIFPWGKVTTNKPHITILRREFDHFLSQQAVKAGAELRLRSEVKMVERISTGNMVVRVLEKSCGREVNLRTKVVVFSDGPNSLASTLFGFGYRRNPQTAAVGLIYEMEWAQCPMTWHEIHVGEKIASWGYAWVFPKQDLVNVGIVRFPSKGNESKGIEKTLREFIQNHSLLNERQIIRRIGAFIPIKPAMRLYQDSMLVVGDSAGMVEPMTEAGIANGILAAQFAGKVIHEALLKENYSAQFFRQYQNMWRSSDRYKMIRFQYTLARLFQPFSQLDRNAFAKLLQITFLGGSLNRRKKLSILTYPYFNNFIAGPTILSA